MFKLKGALQIISIFLISIHVLFCVNLYNNYNHSQVHFLPCYLIVVFISVNHSGGDSEA